MILKVPLFRFFSLVLIIISGSIDLSSQSYNKLIENEKTWKITDWVSGWANISYRTDTYKFGNDTLINDRLYQQLKIKYEGTDQYRKNPIRLLREDTLSKRVFMYDVYADENEILLYDFSLVKNDTFNSNLSGCPIQLIVDSVKEISINDEPHQKLFFRDEGNGFPEYWIEGIGSNNGIIYPGIYQCMIDGGYYLTCVHMHDTLIYMDPNVSECDPSTTDINYQPFVEQILFATNPNRFQISYITTESSLQIYSISGVLLEEIELNGENVAIPSAGIFTTGIYIYRFISGEVQIQGKFYISNP